MTTVLHVSSSCEAVGRAVAALEAGECVALPTETVYGLAADATNGMAVARIFEMKGRPRFNPLICHVADLAMAMRLARFNAASERLARRFWPGPLTLVVPLRENAGIAELVTAGLETVALRCPLGPARTIIERLGRPLAAPSANRSGRVSPTLAAHVAEDYPDSELLIIDDGPCAVGIESAIVRAEADRLVMLRPGAVTRDELENAADLPVEMAGNGGIEAPGMLASHYAPRAAMVLNVADCPPGAALLAFGGSGKDRSKAVAMRNLSERADLREAAANLYRHIKALDAQAVDLIAVEPIPAGGLGAAINDRLARAAAPRDG